MATVFFSAAIKGVPDTLIDAARVDGATKRQVFYKVTLPYISATVVAVATITAIGALKVFDIVAATTGGNFGTSTIANEFYRIYFVQGRNGFGSAFAVLLFVFVIPVVVFNRRAQRRAEELWHEQRRTERRASVVTEPVEATTIGSGALPDDTTVDAAMGGGEPIGRSVSASLSSRGGRYIVIALVLLWTIPTFGLLVSSVRPENEVKTSGWWEAFIRPKFTLGNYDAVLSSSPGSANLAHFFFNSMKITLPAVMLSVGIGAMAAYAFSWMRFKGRDWLFVAVVAMLVVPLQMALIPLLRC